MIINNGIYLNFLILEEINCERLQKCLLDKV